MIELSQILAGLIQRTEEGKLQWIRTVEDDRFISSVDAISIVVVEVKHPNYRLEILNESGETVESLEYESTTPTQDQQLASLYALARRSALNTDVTLEKLAKALEL